MPKIVQINCDICKAEPDMTKGYLMLGVGVIKFTKNGPAKVGIEQYFCSTCAIKLLDLIEKLNIDTTRTD